MQFRTRSLSNILFWIGIFLSLVIGVFTRFVGLTQFPPSLYWEEAALGYDAYSILKTGHDLHGHFLPIVAFESFGDFKPSFYFYALVPSIAVFGLTDFAVRFPSALSGLFLIVGVGLLAKELGFSLLKDKKKQSNLPQTFQVITMLITSLSPWAIEFSRGGWEVNLATTLLTFGMWFQLLIRRRMLDEQIDSSPKFYILSFLISVILIALSMYTYHSTRVVAPLLLLGTWIDITAELWLKSKKRSQNISESLKDKVGLIFFAGILFTILILPILLSLHSVETQQRFTETSLFADGRQVKLSNELISQSNPHWLGKILYHRYVISADMIIENYLSHFSYKFLFLSGDNNPRHSTQFVGLMYSGELFILLVGLYFLFSKRNPFILLIFLWLFVGVMPAALTTATPHALRILPSLPAWMIILAAGVIQMSMWVNEIFVRLFAGIKVKKSRPIPLYFMLLVFLLFYGWQFVSYWRFYSIIYPKVYAAEWQFGYKQMIADLQLAENSNPTLPVQVTREYGRPAMYYWFYTKTDPREVQAEEATAKKDQGEFLQFKNITFVDQVNIQGKTLVASTEGTYEATQAKGVHTQLLNTVFDPLHKIVWVIYTAE